MTIVRLFDNMTQKKDARAVFVTRGDLCVHYNTLLYVIVALIIILYYEHRIPIRKIHEEL